MRRSWTPAPLAAMLVALAGCGDSNGPGAPSDDQATAIGLTARDEVEAALNSLSLATLLSPIGTAPETPCATPSSATDSDGDGIPDDAVYNFVAPPCRFGDFRGGTLELIGQLQIQDPVPGTAGFGYEATITTLRTPFSAGDAGYSITRNGFRVLGGSISALQLTTDLQAIRTFPGQSDAAVEEQWTVAYTPESPLQINRPVPSGTLDVSGTFGWARGTESFALTVTTPTPLHYNAGCAGSPQRFDAGELHASGVFGETPGRVQLRWSGCGDEPEIEFVSEGE